MNRKGIRKDFTVSCGTGNVQKGCSLPKDKCPPDAESVMTNPSPHPYKEWCWQTAMVYEFIASVIFGTMVLWSVLAPIGPAGAGLTQGLAFFIIVSLFKGHHAGYANPTIVMMFAVLGKLPGKWWGLVVYWIAEILGFLIATVFTLAISPGFNTGLGLGAPVIAGALGVGQAALVELVGGFFLHLVVGFVYGFIDQYIYDRKETKLELAEDSDSGKSYYKKVKQENPLRIVEGLILGLTYVALVIPLILFTGASFNILRWFFPSLIAGIINNNWWVYAVMPFLSMLAAYIILFPILYWEKLRSKAWTKMSKE